MNHEKLIAAVETSQREFRAVLETILLPDGSMPELIYFRYLNMQYHLTKGVQRHFFIAASHPDFTNRKKFRDFLYNFGIEEEPHYEIALKDMNNAGYEATSEAPFDVRIWWAYFNSVVYDRPLLRLGATCILENIAKGSHDLINGFFKTSPYLTPRNTVFFRIHRHDESIPHGDQILASVLEAKLNEQQYQDLVSGAEQGWLLYKRMVEALKSS